MLCGTDPLPELFRAKKYKIHDRYLNKTDFKFIMNNLPIPVNIFSKNIIIVIIIIVIIKIKTTRHSLCHFIKNFLKNSLGALSYLNTYPKLTLLILKKSF